MELQTFVIMEDGVIAAFFLQFLKDLGEERTFSQCWRGLRETFEAFRMTRTLCEEYCDPTLG